MTSTTHLVTSVTVQINAPAAFVWDVLVDYPSYPEWNPTRLPRRPPWSSVTGST